jgi:hypothetical protein
MFRCSHQHQGEYYLSLLKLYEGRLISNAHSEISRKRDHVFKQTKVGLKYNILATN